MVLCLDGSVIFMPHRKTWCGNPVNLINVLMWELAMYMNRMWDKLLRSKATSWQLSPWMEEGCNNIILILQDIAIQYNWSCIAV